ncbi:MAG: hypothetical protein GTN89_02905 [Acidobacteria bacterium]|nr:hypothetical protein [Acidobacteriota bacterium]NIM62544.1 hypothetical protein [Acidobacteriota bacterium]NIO58277.1 hypothetical protein [Acidobacteriota bacterium]NIQ29333.1 hypothetical protein [Acidobacteriota bacterium]NIQ83933.1 hypothetical protein [Acidobacteriota bacterium]
MLLRIAIAATVLLFVPCVVAAEPELVTDRPDQTESTEIVPKGQVQTELGLGDADGAEATAAGLVRVGLAERVELRIGLDEVFLSGPEDAVDMSVGAKFRLLGEGDRRPAIAVIAAVNQKLGDSLSPVSDGLRPGFRFAFSHTLSERLSLGYNAGVSWDETVRLVGMPAVPDKELESRFLWTAALGIGATDRLGFFVEAFGDTGLSDDGPTETALDGGVTFLLRPNVQLDLFVGAGISDAAPDWLAGAGVSFRLPD